MSTILALLCKQASYPGRGAALGTVAGGLAGYGLADEDQRIEGAAAGAALGGLGGYGLGRAYTHRPLGPAITDKARLLGAGGEGAAELEELRRAYPTRKSLLETAHRSRDRSPATSAPTPANLANKRLTQGVLAGGAIGGATAAGAADDGNGLEAGARGAFGGAFIGGAATLPYLHHLDRSIKLEDALAKAKALDLPRSAQRKMQVHVDDVRGTATRAARIGAAVGVPLSMAVGAGHANDVNEERKTASILDAIFAVA